MKRTRVFVGVALSVSFLLATTLSAQVPQLINYQGILTDPNAGEPVSGERSLTFSIYDVSTGGTALWSETQTVAVDNGRFSVVLGRVNPISPLYFINGWERYLGVKVGGDAEMTPRKSIASVTYSLVSGYSLLAVDAAKLGGKDAAEYVSSPMVGNSSDPILSLSNEGNGHALKAQVIGSGSAGYFSNNDFMNNSPAIDAATYGSGRAGYFHVEYNLSAPPHTNPALEGRTNGSGSGVLGGSVNGPGVHGVSTNGYGVKASSTNNYGIFGETSGSGYFAGYFKGTGGIRTETVAGSYAGHLDNAVRITRSGWHGLQIDNSSWAGIWVDNAGSDGFSVKTAGRHGFHVQSADQHGMYIEDTVNGDAIHIDGAKGHGIHIDSAGGQGVDVAAANANGVQVYSAGKNGVAVASANWSGVYVASAGGDAIRVQTAGQDGLRFFEGVGRDYIRAGSDADLDFRVTKNGTAYADGGWQGSADFAELIEIDGSEATFEPGDVLVISQEKDRAVTLSSQPYSTDVIGIYSAKPGFVGSTHPMEDKYHNEIPVAITGIVPCNVSAEGGPIHRGDLLTTSSTPGYAMKATEVKIGTILGKAMQSLDSGKGKIEVLVVLH